MVARRCAGPPASRRARARRAARMRSVMRQMAALRRPAQACMLSGLSVREVTGHLRFSAVAESGSGRWQEK